MFIRKMSQFVKRPYFEIVTQALVVSTALIAACPAAYANGGGPGNGGDAVLLNGKWTLLDLAEAGITRSSRFEKARTNFKLYYGKGEKAHRSLIRGIVNEVFGDQRFTAPFREALSAKLTYSGFDTVTLVAAMRLYQWQLTNAELRNIGDERSTLDLSKLKTIQLAVRLDDRVQIYAPVFLQMDLLNQVALVFHEIIYSLVKPIADENENLYQPSWQARSQVVCEFADQSGPCESLAEKKYAKDRHVFEASNTVLSLTTFGTSKTATYGEPNGEETYELYSDNAEIVICDGFPGETLRIPQRGRRSTALPGAGAIPKNCVVINIMHTQYGRGDFAPRSDIERFCNGKTKGEVVALGVMPSVFWRLEELVTETGPTRRPVVSEGVSEYSNAPMYSAGQARAFSSTEGCIAVATGMASIIDKEDRKHSSDFRHLFAK
jgi:hypothetical protein